MNNQELVLARRKIWNKYNSDGNRLHRCKINSCNLHSSNSLPHELAKAEVCWHLKKMKMYYITEARSNDGTRRPDIVCLDDGVEYEIETTKARAKRFENKSNVVVIKLWEKPKISALVGNT